MIQFSRRISKQQLIVIFWSTNNDAFGDLRSVLFLNEVENATRLFNDVRHESRALRDTCLQSTASAQEQVCDFAGSVITPRICIQVTQVAIPKREYQNSSHFHPILSTPLASLFN